MLDVKTTFLVDCFSKKIVSWMVLPWTKLKMVLMFIYLDSVFGLIVKC